MQFSFQNIFHLRISRKIVLEALVLVMASFSISSLCIRIRILLLKLNTLWLTFFSSIQCILYLFLPLTFSFRFSVLLSRFIVDFKSASGHQWISQGIIDSRTHNGHQVLIHWLKLRAQNEVHEKVGQKQVRANNSGSNGYIGDDTSMTFFMVKIISLLEPKIARKIHEGSGKGHGEYGQHDTKDIKDYGVHLGFVAF